jgi:hypothetical protein
MCGNVYEVFSIGLSRHMHNSGEFPVLLYGFKFAGGLAGARKVGTGNSSAQSVFLIF